MDFSMKEGGGFEFHIRILKNDFSKRVLQLVWTLYYVYIVVEVTMNLAK